jgi:hypothetical protein
VYTYPFLPSEEGKAKILALKRDETDADKYTKDIAPLWTNLEVTAIP